MTVAMEPRHRKTGSYHFDVELNGFDRKDAVDSEGAAARRDVKVEARPRCSVSDYVSLGLLVLLYAMQGVPLGLTMGSMPFLLQSKLSYGQMGLFSISAYPYSFKLLWSPLVDSIYSSLLGRRKSWIVPIQLLSSAMLIVGAPWLQAAYEGGQVAALTAYFFCIVLLAATQDIAVDGWALTLLPRSRLEYAATCQSVGMNIGYFTSFTVFLALNDAQFCNTYLQAGAPRLYALLASRRDGAEACGLVSLEGYVKFWGWLLAVFTLAIAVLKREEGARGAQEPHIPQVSLSSTKLRYLQDSHRGGVRAALAQGAWRARVRAAYLQLWGVVQLPAIWQLSLFLVVNRLGMLPAENAAALKLLEKGVAKEALASLVLVQFPVDVVSAMVAGRWATARGPYAPFMAAYAVRLAAAAGLTWLVSVFPANAASLSAHPAPFLALACISLVTSFTSTLMFTAISSFFNSISDPDMGGAYLTLLNTISNIGVVLPKTPMLYLIGVLTKPSCLGLGGGMREEDVALLSDSCPHKVQQTNVTNACTQAGGQCEVTKDGFQSLSYTMILAGIFFGFLCARLMAHLHRLPLSSWRAKKPIRRQE